MIHLKPVVNPGYGYLGQHHVYIGTVHHRQTLGPAVSMNCGYESNLLVRRYLCGLEPPNYPVPAIIYAPSFPALVGWGWKRAELRSR